MAVVDAIYEAMAICQALHPDAGDAQMGDSDDEDEGDAQAQGFFPPDPSAGLLLLSLFLLTLLLASFY